MMRLSLLLLLAGAGCVSASRSLFQVPGDALGNSDGCLATIPKCEPGACATRNIGGVATWVCLRCLANYDPVVDVSGQDNIIQCGEWVEWKNPPAVPLALPRAPLRTCSRSQPGPRASNGHPCDS
jgi:hypothetical protein